MKTLFIFSCISLLFFLGCGYHFTPSPLISNGKVYSIEVPYVRGDIDGRITDAIVREISQCPKLRYVNSSGDLILQVYILSDNVDIIGFQFDRDEITGKRENRLRANEERRSLEIEFSILSSLEGKILAGPFVVVADADYDFIISDVLKDASFINQEGKRKRTLFFSLGQLDSKEGAYYSCSGRLFQNLAKKIINGICHLDLESCNP
ncbi:MAG: hypothetical protein Tsb0015_03640 [Simkaniaceae bacterium]